MQEPNLSLLGPFPILQFFGGLLILAACVYAWLRGQKAPRDEQPPPQVTWRFDGPIAIALKRLEENAANSARLENQFGNVAEETRNQTRLLTEIRDAISRSNQLLDRIGRSRE